MANVQRGEAEFDGSDGKRYKIVLDFYAFAEAEDAADMGVNDLLAAIDPKVDPVTKQPTRTPRIKHLGALMYGGLKANHPNITPADAIRVMGSSEEAGAALGKALEACMPKPDASAEGKEPADPKSGTGTKRKPTGQARA